MVRPGVLRFTYENGSFFAEYTIDGRKLLGVHRGGTVEFDLPQIEREAQTQPAQPQPGD